MMRQIKNAGFNIVIFQIRPLNDAFYPSKLNPYSRYLTGREGVGFSDKNFDPLAFMISETHRFGMEFHAWFNPYRINNGTKLTKQQYLASLSPENFAVKNPECVLTVPQKDGKRLLMLDPGHPKVKMFLCDTIREVLENYQIDAVHLDDYFYPYSGIGDADLATYRRYGKSFSSIDDWRRNNVNSQIQIIHSLVRLYSQKKKTQIRFGISPFGIWANRPLPNSKGKNQKSSSTQAVQSHPSGSLTSGMQSYYAIYADSRKWIKEGWVDYIVPQLYWAFGHETAPYAALADWWADQVKGTSVDLYIGHSIYKEGTDGHWQNPGELASQLKYNMLHPEIRGSFFFAARHILSPENAIQKKAVQMVIENLWKCKAPFSSSK